jgi:hypothetical protein
MSVRSRDARDAGLGALTFVDHLGEDGLVVRWESRRHRKHLEGPSPAGSTWWAPRSRGWWIAVLFAVGSLLFAVGSVPGYVTAVGARWDSVTYFIGSLFFTSAAFLTYREAAWRPRSWAWWIALANLLGSVAFGVSVPGRPVSGTAARCSRRRFRSSRSGSCTTRCNRIRRSDR